MIKKMLKRAIAKYFWEIVQEFLWLLVIKCLKLLAFLSILLLFIRAFALELLFFLHTSFCIQVKQMCPFNSSTGAE